MEYSIKPKRFGRKENNPLPSKEDNWIIREFMNIEIPPIYEEDIIEFAQRKGDVVFKYYDNDNIFEIVFNSVYVFDFVEFDYINETGGNSD